MKNTVRIIVIVFFLICPSLAMAQDVSVDASVSSNKISLKDADQLVLTVHGGKGNIQPVQLPKIDGLDSTYVGPSTKISIINGQYSSEHAFTYNLFPNKTGHFQIPALTLTVDGQAYTTQPIDLEVTNGPAANSSNSPGTGTPTDEAQLKDRISMNLSTPKADVFLGEKVPISIKLLVNQLPIRNIQFPKFDKNGFTMDDIGQPRQYSQIINGVKYDVVDFHTFIYPTRTGQISVGPVEIQGSLLYKNAANPPSGFGDDFFNGFFDTYQERPINVTSQSMNLNVLPLPEEGKPSDFSGAVGQLDFSASVSPSQVKVGDPITLRMKVSGQANFKSFQLPSVNAPDFKTYDPQVKDEPNAETSEQVLIPTSDNITEVPAISFNYFDSSDGQYKTLTQGPFPLKVLRPKAGEEFKAVGFTDLSPKPVAQVDYVQEYIKAPLQKLMHIMEAPAFWLWALLVLVVGVLGWLWRSFQKRLSEDHAFARRLNALRYAKQGLKQAQERLAQGRPEQFYDSIFKTLNNYLADQFHRPTGSLTGKDAIALLQEKDVPEEQVDAVKELFDTCDMVRFAGTKPGAAAMQEDFNKLQSVLTELEKHFK